MELVVKTDPNFRTEFNPVTLTYNLPSTLVRPTNSNPNPNH